MFNARSLQQRTFSEWLRSGAAAFRRNRDGNVSIIFAIALIPIIGAVGAAVDYSRANSVKASLQASLDATALMLSKEASSLTTSQLTEKATNYFMANFNRPEATNVVVSPSFSSSAGSQLIIAATAHVPTTFMGVMGFSYLGVDSTTIVKWGTTRLRVSLVLDTTGSMNSDGKITALKTATKNLIDQLEDAVTVAGDVYVAIIPFSKNVNLGASNYNATWIDWTDWEAEPQVLDTTKGGSKPSNWSQIGPGSSCPFSLWTHGFRCASAPAGTNNVSNIPTSGPYAGYICPGGYSNGDQGTINSTKIGISYNGCYNSVQQTNVVSSGWGASCGTTPNCSCTGWGSNRVCTQTYYQHTWRPANTAAAPAHSTWNGCVTDRGTWAAPSQDYDRKVTAPSPAIPASLFPAEQNSYCSPQVMGLSYDWIALKNLVDSLYPSGATNQPIGLVWGWQALVGGGPLTVPAQDANYTYKQAIILMSDGLNTLDRWYGNGSSTNTQVDARMYQSSITGTCANIKAAGITIYALQVNTGGDPESTLLKNCASATDKFWMVTAASEINTVFNTIGTDLTKLRVAQ